MIDGSCPYDPSDGVIDETLRFPVDQLVQLAGSPEAGELRDHLLDWYINTGFRGCLFNKIAARNAKQGKDEWVVPVEYAPIDEVLDGEAGARILANFETLLSSDPTGLISYIFPNINKPEDYGNLLKFLVKANPDRFRILPVVDRAPLGPEGFEEDYVGVQFRIKVGESIDGADVFSYPMIYTPDDFTTFARRYDYFAITFNGLNQKHNPETPDTYIGVDDIDLGLSERLFRKLFDRSVEVNRDAHSISGHEAEGGQFSRKLFRAHNSLVLPSRYWEDA